MGEGETHEKEMGSSHVTQPTEKEGRSTFHADKSNLKIIIIQDLEIITARTF